MGHGWVQVHILGSNINTTQPNQIQIKYVAFLDFESNTNIFFQMIFLIQIPFSIFYIFGCISKYDINQTKYKVQA